MADPAVSGTLVQADVVLLLGSVTWKLTVPAGVLVPESVDVTVAVKVAF